MDQTHFITAIHATVIEGMSRSAALLGKRMIVFARGKSFRQFAIGR
jgi:hypothetical protein